MLFSFFKPVFRSQIADQVEVVIQMGMNAAQTIKFLASATAFTGPAARQATLPGALPNGNSPAFRHPPGMAWGSGDP